MRGRLLILLTGLVSAIVTALGACEKDEFGAASDAGTSSPIEAAASDGATLGEASAAPFCKSVDAAFCIDFDEPGATVESGWTKSIVMHGAIGIDPSIHRSPPGSFSSTIEALDAGSGNAYLMRILTNRVSHIELAFDVFFPSKPSAFAQLVNVYVDDGARTYALQFAVWADGTAVFGEYAAPSDAGPGASQTWRIPFSPDAGRWTHVDLAAKLGTSATLSGTVDGKPIMVNAPLQTGGVGKPALTVGALSVDGPAPAQSFRFDNVVMVAD